MQTDEQKLILENLSARVGRFDNAGKDDARWISWLREDDDCYRGHSNEEIAAIALNHGYRVYKSPNGFYGHWDYLIVRPNCSINAIMQHWNEFGDDEELTLDDFDFKKINELGELF